MRGTTIDNNLQKGADMHLKDKFGETASVFADSSGYYEVARFLSKCTEDTVSSNAVSELEELRKTIDANKPKTGRTLYTNNQVSARKNTQKRNSR